MFLWTHEHEATFNLLKEKLVSAPILVFPNWKVEFHVVDASMIALGSVLAQLREGNMDHPIYFSSRKISQA